jgi:choice-of-anchor B domain-containing protein
MALRLKLTAALAASLVLAATAAPQAAQNISLLARINLSTFGSQNGNSCWGYVSPSGREYAIMGLNNKVAFVEITNPSQPNWFASIPHGSSLWADVKVYRNACYVVTEGSGMGIQVIDMSNIDAATNRVTLVRTLPAPGRNHTIAVDPDSGFLYTCGSRDGTGTTTCFSLADPLNPVQVGMASLTPVYQHEAQVVTYTSGRYAGKQIFFGGGEGRGLEIWDVTDKNAVTLIRRVTYPFVGYCHQGWLSPDRRYYYVNDEFDESNQGIPTRTLVFDVSVLETAELVATYTTGKLSVDHNLYNRNGFIFHSNYTSGLYVFDGNDNPTAPTMRGWYDTYASNDGASFNGAWSNYPFFPSGTVIVSDINGGLFILDVSEATKRTFAVGTVTVDRGVQTGGNVGNLADPDGNAFSVRAGLVSNQTEPPIRIVMEGASLWQDVSRLQFKVRSRTTTTNVQQTIELYDFVAATWVSVDSRAIGTAFVDVTGLGANPDRFVETGTKKIRARVSLKPNGLVSSGAWQGIFDEAEWIVNP